MFPLGFVLGAVTGVAATLLASPKVIERARPVAKAALKATLTAMHDVRVRGAEIAEAAEDLYAEAKAEATADVVTAAMAAAGSKAEESRPADEPSSAGDAPSRPIMATPEPANARAHG